MKYLYYVKKIAIYQRKYLKMTHKQRKSWYGQWIAWRLRKMTLWCREVDRAVDQRHRSVGEYENNAS